MPDYYEFEVSHCEAPSRTWRRFLLAKRGAAFADLHHAIQDACGWKNYHLYCFMTGGVAVQKSSQLTGIG